VVAASAGVVVLAPVTVPIVGLMEIVVEAALVTVQLNVDVLPGAIMVGDAVNEGMDGRRLV